MIHIAVLTLRLHLEGCSSLKEKRRRLNGLRDRFGRQPNMAVCESDLQDAWQEAEWSFVAVANSRAMTDRLIAQVETFLGEMVDARVVSRELEYA